MWKELKYFEIQQEYSKPNSYYFLCWLKHKRGDSESINLFYWGPVLSRLKDAQALYKHHKSGLYDFFKMSKCKLLFSEKILTSALAFLGVVQERMVVRVSMNQFTEFIKSVWICSLIELLWFSSSLTSMIRMQQLTAHWRRLLTLNNLNFSLFLTQHHRMTGMWYGLEYDMEIIDQDILVLYSTKKKVIQVWNDMR